MRILIATDAVYPFSMGGSHRLVYEASLALVSRGHSVVCVVPEMVAGQQSSHDGTRWVDQDGFRIVTFPVDRRNLLTKVRSLFTGFRAPVEHILATEHIDVVNVHYLPALFALRSLRSRPIRYTFHGPWSGELRLSLAGRMEAQPYWRRFLSRIALEPFVYAITMRLERHLLRRCNTFATISSYMKDLLVEMCGSCAKSATVIPAGVNLREFFPDFNGELRLSAAGMRRFLLLTVRRLEKRMGLDNLIRAAAILRDAGEDFILLIGGKGHQQIYLERLIQEYDLTQNVQLLGFVPDERLREYLSTADLFVLPSVELEGFGLVILEAMACGTPVLVSPVGGAKEIVGELNRQFVMDGTSPSAIADRLTSVMHSGILNERAVSIAACVLARELSWDRFAVRFENWLSSAPESGPRSDSTARGAALLEISS